MTFMSPTNPHMRLGRTSDTGKCQWGGGDCESASKTQFRPVHSHSHGGVQDEYGRVGGNVEMGHAWDGYGWQGGSEWQVE